VTVIGRAPNWNPSVPGNACILWCRADMGVTANSNTSVVRWADMSPYGNHLLGLNIGGSTNPLWLPSDSPQPSHQMLCDTTDAIIGAFNVANPAGWNTGTGPIHLWAVIGTPATWPGTHTIHGPIFDKNSTSAWTGPNTGDGVGLGINVISGQGTWSFLYPGLLQAQNIPTATMVNNSTYMIESVWDGGVLTISMNGQTIFQQSISTYTSATQTNTLYVGLIGAVSNRAFPGKIYEIGAFNVASKTNQDLLRQYVRSRYRCF